ncbi:transglutaminase-like domain-containing protein [Pelagerythrobacter marinus]|jgi:transglutaminase-like putative cysteine protease|uniref:Transglutaminase family protein n=1 Tax=Pelagerythrobacter marinus TaxID=538382 RepID=A0ABW9UZP8_9SPHN|nr:transglutaminase family protein [Pelagerythrobacter marinus]MEC9067432.1 transglutaminase family protein [Pseudomonadota bacterium]MXO69298.1 transglutaminase family protein [Pelagerythrobacter marinus]USA39850.1 transglutaminase family protein [Pelagerythrobacter marinus]WPZ06019.1 transglutaminase family protein [Pelagerythrobacter marinus]
MAISIDLSFAFRMEQPTDVLLQFEAAPIPEQRLLETDTRATKGAHFARIPAQDAIGERVWIRAEGRYEVTYRATVAVERMQADIAGLERLPPHELPGETVQYLFDSRYCPADRFQSFVEAEFGRSRGGARIAAIRDWIAGNFAYAPGSSTSNTTGLDSFIERRGICRDYAHVTIMLARASGVPARFVSCFAPGVTPQDFHAVAEVFLTDPTTPGGGAWYLVDATDMARADEIVKIGVGRDAADVSFMTSFGPTEFIDKAVQVGRTAGGE